MVLLILYEGTDHMADKILPPPPSTNELCIVSGNNVFGSLLIKLKYLNIVNAILKHCIVLVVNV